MIHPLHSKILRGVDELERVAAGTVTLARGVRGDAVIALQRGLVELGYGLEGGADGVFGQATEAGLRSFRELHGRSPAGALDATTLALLDASLVRAEAAAEHTLRNPRFAGNAHLERVLRGRGPLPQQGEAVERVQQALLDLQFALPRWGVDGVLGVETHQAIRQFQSWQRIRRGGELTPLTLTALDQCAPAPGERVTRSPVYDRLIRDGVLTVTVAVGYDGEDHDLREFAALQAGLRREGFVPTLSSEPGVLAFVCPLMIAGQAGSMRVRTISRRTVDAEERFADGLVQDSVCIYAGGARACTTPDFEDAEFIAENFRIGITAPDQRGPDESPTHGPILAGVPDELLTRRFDPRRYQLWAFAGCTTRHYLDELRRLLVAKRTENLDLVVSTRPLQVVDSAFYPLEIIRGLLRGRTVNEITGAIGAHAARTEKIFGVVHAGAAFFGDGFGDNAPGWRVAV